MLVFVGLSAVVVDFDPRSPIVLAVPSASWRRLITGMIFAASGSLFALTPLGKRSGAHLNPSVTLAFLLTGHVHRDDVAGYVVAQGLGAIAGSVLLRAVWDGAAASISYGVTAPGPGVSPSVAVMIESGMTAVLILTIFVCVSTPRFVRWTPLAVWIVVAILVWQGAGLTGTSLNPARSLGPAIVAGQYRGLWIYFIGPLSGASVVALLWRLLKPRLILTAKIFHDPRYPSVVHTRLPALPARGHGR